MRYNDFKDLKVSALGFGTMRLPMDASGAIDYNEERKDGCRGHEWRHYIF